MAKKTKPKRKDNESEVNGTDLKYIGAAIDHAVSSLENIKARAVKPREVDKKITALKKIANNVSRECRQSWFLAFDVEDI